MKNFKTKLFGAMMFLLLPAIALASPSGDLQRILKPASSAYQVGGTLRIISGGTLQMDSGSTLTLNNGSIATLGGTLVQAGAAGTAGTVRVYPTTTASGYFKLAGVDNTGNFISTLSNSNIGQATVYSLPDCGNATCDIVTTKGTQSVTGVKTFTTPVLGAATATTINGIALTAGTGTLTITGTKTLGVSNTITLAAGADGQTFTFPATTDTVVGLAATQTLTGKTLTSPVITGPAPVACGGTCTLGTANIRTYTKLDTASGSVATLPTATGTGNVYKMVVTVSTGSNSDKVLLATVTDAIIGRAVGFTGAGGASKTFDGSAGTYHSLQMPFAGTQPSGGILGDMIECTDVAAALYVCDVKYQGGTTPTTPFSTSTT